MTGIDYFYKGDYLATIAYIHKERDANGKYEFVDIGSLGIATSYEETMTHIWGDAVDLVDIDSPETLEVSFEETVDGELVTNVKWGQNHEFMRSYRVLFHKRPNDA